jgi:tripeptidyl-peptidase I
MTRDEVIALTSNPESQDEIIAYLKAAGARVTLVEHSGGTITANAPISIWERMLNTEFYSYSLPSSIVSNDILDVRNKANLHTFVRTEEYSVPLALDSHVAYVMNTVQLPQLRSSNLPVIKVITDELSSRSSRFSEESVILYPYITPQKLNNVYNIDDNTGHPRATQAAYETVKQLFSPQDLTTFQTKMVLPIRAVNQSYGNMTATAAQCKARGYSICAEGNLDIMYMMGIADTPTIHWYTDTPMAWYLFALVYAPTPPPLVISMSYGSEERYLSISEYTTFEESAKKLGVMGVTVVASAGDDGVSPHPARHDATKCSYMPTWPASCPYVISVGATQVFL